jgi:membrane fusion protein, multidrug efflux system
MDERTRTTDHELDLAPQFRRASPKPEVKGRVFSRMRIGIGLIVVVALALGIWQIARFARTAPAPTGRAAQATAEQSVGASTVSLHDVPVVVDALGTVTPLATVTVQTQISGYLTDVKFTEGDMVKKGEPLAQIDQRPYDILKTQYEGQLAHDQGLLAQAKADLTRFQTLAKQNSIALQQADDQQFLVQQYEGTVKQDQAMVATQALNIAYCNIISPVTGRVGLRLVDPGNYVTPQSTTGIAVVTQLQPITVIFSVPEDDLPEIMPQLNGGGTLQVTAFDRANQKQLAVGKVIAVDNQIDTTTGTVKVRAQFDNSDNALFPNQFVNAELLVKTLQNAVAVPTAAIQRGAPGASGGALGSYVYVINADSTVTVRPIKTGPTTMSADNISLTEVPSGLKAGERVVTDGADRLREGLHVNVTTLDGKRVAPAAAPTGGGGHRHNGDRRGGAAAPGAAGQ